MHYYADTANLKEIQQMLDWGILDGVTTNPSLVAKEGHKDFHEFISKLTEIVYPRPVSAEVISLNFEGMIEEARKLAKIRENVVVKIPCTPDGIKAVNYLSKEGINTNVTLIFSPMQALTAAKAGATYISPFIGRLDDVSSDGMKMLQEVIILMENYGLETQVIAASIRHPMHLLEAALMGADIATAPFKVWQQVFKHPLTDIGIEKFLADWEALQKK